MVKGGNQLFLFRMRPMTEGVGAEEEYQTFGRPNIDVLNTFAQQLFVGPRTKLIFY